jgi:hypothetical protein
MYVLMLDYLKKLLMFFWDKLMKRLGALAGCTKLGNLWRKNGCVGIIVVVRV